MPGVRDHEPVVIEQFNGLWKRGDAESAPSDHFTEATNIQYMTSGFETRDGIDTYHTPATSIGDVRRVYNYVSNFGDSLLILTTTPNPTEGDPDRVTGQIHHLWKDIIHPPILTVVGMDDFDCVGIAGYAYITPFRSYKTLSGEIIQMGVKNEFLYVYRGAGAPARKAGGKRPLQSQSIPPNSFTVPVQGGDQPNEVMDEGFHIYAVVYETETGYLTAPGPVIEGPPIQYGFVGQNHNKMRFVNVTGIPVGPVGTTKRHIVSTKAIPEYNGDPTGYQFFFIPNATIPNTAPHEINNIGFFDADLIDDASHLMDNLSEIPSGVALTTYHSRLVIVGEYGLSGPPDTVEDTLEGLPVGMTDNRSLARISYPGEPEAISKIDGLIIAPMDGNPLTNAQEFRDILYLFKKTRTYGYSDNGDEPASWQEEIVDQGTGSPVHGVATVLDSGGVNIDYLLIADWSGLVMFNGVYARPELSWKIEDFWLAMDKNGFNRIQIVLDTINKKIWLTIPQPRQNMMLFADYTDGLDAKNIKWAIWTSFADIGGLTLTDDEKVIISAYQHTFAPIPGTPNVSGLYVINPDLRHDVYYNRSVSPVVKFNWQIPDPTIRTALFGE